MVRVFCDFDGTIAVRDVGATMFKAFGGRQAEETVRLYLSGSINARECFVRECEAVPHLTRREFLEFIDQFELDPGFSSFVKFCEGQGIPVTVVSDGFDLYVRRLLEKNGLGRLTTFANHVEFVESNGSTRMVPSFPYRDADCDQCANCKRNHLLTLSADDDIIVYVGDGFSDRCPVRYADIVFAKRSLLTYCQEQNITSTAFRTFDDVRSRMEGLLQGKRLKGRREAVMARRDVYKGG
jgi:2-hydroxy-3-keto-5-methylthiopentenyl-1-phosphate phosphatase